MAHQILQVLSGSVGSAWPSCGVLGLQDGCSGGDRVCKARCERQCRQWAAMMLFRDPRQSRPFPSALPSPCRPSVVTDRDEMSCIRSLEHSGPLAWSSRFVCPPCPCQHDAPMTSSWPLAEEGLGTRSIPGKCLAYRGSSFSDCSFSDCFSAPNCPQDWPQMAS